MRRGDLVLMERTMINQVKWEDLQVGDTGIVTKTITEADVVNFAGIIGDFNPIHVSIAYAETTQFKQRLAHGMLTASFISTVIGNCLPGMNALYLSQNIKFIKPVYIGDTIKAKGEIIKLIPEKRRMVIKTTVENQRGELVVNGEAEAMLMG